MSETGDAQLHVWQAAAGTAAQVQQWAAAVALADVVGVAWRVACALQVGDMVCGESENVDGDVIWSTSYTRACLQVQEAPAQH